jgi:hypothetical protein
VGLHHDDLHDLRLLQQPLHALQLHDHLLDQLRVNLAVLDHLQQQQLGWP